MKFLKKKLKIFVALVASTYLAILLVAGHLQQVSAKTTGFQMTSSTAAAISSKQSFDENNASQLADDKSGDASFLLAQTFVDLTGDWQSNDGGTYYLRQRGSELFWYGEGTPISPAFSNVYRGVRSSFGFFVGSEITGNWIDVPKGVVAGSGTLNLRIDSPTQLRTISVTGGFGGSVWTKIRSGF